MPIRTGLDTRIEEVRAELREYFAEAKTAYTDCLLYTSPSPRD